MGTLNTPTPEVAERVMRPVRPGDYVAAFRINGRSRVGGRLFSLAQVHGFLGADDACLDPDGLVEWLAGPLGDSELAEAVKAAYGSCSTGYECMQAARALIGERLAQVGS
ncbi:hypothetical protein [Anaerosoma tenue]|uniref:hypothetical protein n=1 Tax=Anaerosoma tenue TaxID=2933588 RepID=UPI002260C914|nr:hypothetical protein [Anaerosoma tenue]MCK8114812.1 hypothetical protein [Anaerosoma tenue]